MVCYTCVFSVSWHALGLKSLLIWAQDHTMSRNINIIAAAVLALVVSGAQAILENNDGDFFQYTRPFVIGHRGNPYHEPEHTYASYILAIEQGADFIECDMCLTKDLVPVCRHDNWLSDTTDALEKFPDKKATYVIDGETITDVFTVDLTLAELRTLRAKQAFDFRYHGFDGLYQIPTLEEYLQIVAQAPRTVGIYPEMKHTTFHNSLEVVKKSGLKFEDIVLNILKKYGYTGPYNSPEWKKKPIFIQSFEQDDLIYVSKKSCIPLIQLTDDFTAKTGDRNRPYSELLSEDGIKEVSKYATGLGPWKNTLVKMDKDGNLTSTGIVENAHKYGLQVHLYTLRPEPKFIIAGVPNGTTYYEYDLFFKQLDVDGAFTDNAPDLLSYFQAQELAGYGFPLNQRMRLNAQPKFCKRG